MSDTKRDEINNEALAMAVIGHLGPSALAGGKMSVLDAFELGWQAAIASQPEREALPQADAIESAYQHDVEKAIRSINRQAEFIPQLAGCSPESAIDLLAHLYHCQLDGVDIITGEPLPQPSAQSPGIDAVKVPQGYMLVPIEPTDKMTDAAYEACRKFGVMDCAVHLWDAMIYNAPPLPSQPEPFGQAMSDEEILQEAVSAGLTSGLCKGIYPPSIAEWGDTKEELLTFARALLHKTGASGLDAPFDFHAHLARQAAWSEKTFGPGARTAGVCDHIRKELLEIEADPLDLKEWIDVVILALDGAWRCGGIPDQIIGGIVGKQTKNEGRVWPDWRTADPTKAIEHDRSHDAEPSSQPSDDDDTSDHAEIIDGINRITDKD